MCVFSLHIKYKKCTQCGAAPQTGLVVLG